MDTENIFKSANLSIAELEMVGAIFKKIAYRKGEAILSVGDTVNYQYYVESGCLRAFCVDKRGKEHTLQFAVEDWWISDYTAYFSAGKAIMNIECIQDTVLYRTSRNETESLCEEIPGMDTFFRKKLEGGFSTFQKRILSNMADSAMDRYVNFLNNYPKVEQLVKNYHIASYLGITTETLSRVRKKMMER